MPEQPVAAPPAPVRGFPLLTAAVLIVAIMGCAVYANLSFAVENRANLRYFPPFEPHVDRNDNRHLGAEYLNIALAMTRAKASPTPSPAKPGRRPGCPRCCLPSWPGCSGSVTATATR